jgi:hypothetical protein
MSLPRKHQTHLTKLKCLAMPVITKGNFKIYLLAMGTGVRRSYNKSKLNRKPLLLDVAMILKFHTL